MCVCLRLKPHRNDESLSIWQKFHVWFCDFLFDMKLRKLFKVFTMYPSLYLSLSLSLSICLLIHMYVYTSVIYAGKQVVIAIKFAFGFFWLKLISRVP